MASAVGISDGPVFRSVNRGGEIRETALSENVVWQLIRPYAQAAGVPGIAPHDCRRTQLCEVVPVGGRGAGPDPTVTWACISADNGAVPRH